MSSARLINYNELQNLSKRFVNKMLGSSQLNCSWQYPKIFMLYVRKSFIWVANAIFSIDKCKVLHLG